MWLFTLSLVPRLLWNRLVHGRALDIFVTHAPPWGIHDRQDLAHQGAKAFAWLLRVFQPAYHFHGHVHLYRPDIPAESRYQNTRVINTYGYRETTLPD
jgi:Icc-related predicted phosphoesterase